MKGPGWAGSVTSLEIPVIPSSVLGYRAHPGQRNREHKVPGQVRVQGELWLARAEVDAEQREGGSGKDGLRSGLRLEMG